MNILSFLPILSHTQQLTTLHTSHILIYIVITHTSFYLTYIVLLLASLLGGVKSVLFPNRTLQQGIPLFFSLP